MGYSVICFEEKDIDTLDITPETPVFAGVTVFRKVIDKLGIDYPPFDCYPNFTCGPGVTQKDFYGRNIRKSTLGEERSKYEKDGVPVFVKPIKPKVFTGVVFNSILDLIPIAKVPDETPVYVCEPMEIQSEFRVYVSDGDILGVKHYYGDWSIIPSKMFIEQMVERYIDCPIAYGSDIGVHWDKTGYEPGLYGKGPVQQSFVLEVNDGCNLGNYGLDSIHYGEMIVSRWFEIVAGSKIKKKIGEEITELENTEKEFGWEGKFSKSRKDLYFKPNDYNGRTYEHLLVSDEAKKRKYDAMKAFAEMSLEEARKTDKTPESEFVDEPKTPEQFKVDFSAIKEAMKDTTVNDDDKLDVLIKKSEQSYYDGQYPHPDGIYKI